MANVVRQTEIADIATQILAEEGRDALTMRRVASRLGVRAPSLYKHVSGKDEIEILVASRGWSVLASALRASVDPVAAQRRFALAHRALYLLMADRLPDPLPPVPIDRLALGHGLALLELAGADVGSPPTRAVVRSLRGPD